VLGENKRKFKRSATNVLVKFKKEDDIDSKTKHYLQGIAKDSGMGGIFIATDNLMDKGSVISLDFLFLEDGKEVNVQAKAIVRWTQRFRKPKGMGVEFYEFTGLAGVGFEKYLEKLL
jgi:hypothetical protein